MSTTLRRGAGPRRERVPVYAPFDESMGPLLSLGMLTAAARHWDGGVLDEHYEIRRPETFTSFVADIGPRVGPAVLLCSDYVWSTAGNVELARRVAATHPDLVVVHGGPDVPKAEADARRFLADVGDVAHILVRGEGEHVLCRVLETLAGRTVDEAADDLAAIDGLTFQCSDGAVVHTPEQARIADLDELPSPYLTGEFDDLDPSVWNGQPIYVESNRGCPYGCTYCDWGSATMSRIRMFDLDRVVGEVRWAAERSMQDVHFCDANYGIVARDVEIAGRLAEMARATGFPASVSFSPAKNTTKHLARIFDVLIEADVLVSAGISLQTIDDATLVAVDRRNISTDAYLALAADLRRRGQPLVGDLIIGMPGQTVTSYRNDLQFLLDHEIMARTWSAKLLPNAPMNAPDYRAQYEIEVDADKLVLSTSTMSVADRARMLRLRDAEIVAERVGVLRHVLRFLQWDHGVEAMSVVERVLDVIDATPGRFPHLAWVFGYFDILPAAPVNWSAVYRDVRAFVVDEFGVDPSSTALDTVLRLQEFLMPAPGRCYPSALLLRHDYVAYYQSATDELFTSGRSSAPTGPLSSFGPAEFRVHDDPLHIGRVGMPFSDHRDEMIQGEFHLFGISAYELDSPLLRPRTVMGGRDIPLDLAARAEQRLSAIGWDGAVSTGRGIPVALRSREASSTVHG